MEAIVNPTIVIIILGLIAFVSKGFYVLREYERAVIFRFGRLAQGLVGGNGPGVIIILPFIDKLVRVSLRTVTMDVSPPGCHYKGQCLGQSQCGNLFPRC